jgi:hypothetical protein
LQGFGRVAGALISGVIRKFPKVLFEKDPWHSFLFNERRCNMKGLPQDPLDRLSRNLTQLCLDENFLISNEKLVEVIQMELRYLILPEMAKDFNGTFNWSNGKHDIFISIHVEGEDQFSYSIELKELPITPQY